MTIEFKKIKEANEVIKLLNINEPRLQKQIFGDKISYNNYLMQLCKNDRYEIISVYVDGELSFYFVLLNCINLPTTNHVSIVYFSNLYNVKDNEGKDAIVESVEYTKKWAKLIGAKKIYINTFFPRISSLYGFKKSKNVNMELEL